MWLYSITADRVCYLYSLITVCSFNLNPDIEHVGLYLLMMLKFIMNICMMMGVFPTYHLSESSIHTGLHPPIVVFQISGLVISSVQELCVNTKPGHPGVTAQVDHHTYILNITYSQCLSGSDVFESLKWQVRR